MNQYDRDPDFEKMMKEEGVYVYVSIHRKSSTGTKRVCKLSDLDRLSLPRRASLELRHQEACDAVNKAFDEKKGLSISDEIDLIFDVISTVDEETRKEENSLLIMTGDW